MKEHFFIKIKKSYNLIMDLMEYNSKKYGINPIQLSILLISCEKDVNVSTLANILNITKSAVSQALCGLVLKRFVTKQINQDDKKVFYIKPTKKGKEIKESIFQQNEVQYKELLEKMSIDEIVQMCSLIDKFNSILDDFSKSREDLC